jgi:hypothetical protein
MKDIKTIVVSAQKKQIKMADTTPGNSPQGIMANKKSQVIHLAF